MSRPGSDPRRFFSRDVRPPSMPGDVWRVFQDRPLAIGDRCALRSGSPALLVVETHDDGDVTVAWRIGCTGAECEIKIARDCLRRLPPDRGGAP